MEISLQNDLGIRLGSENTAFLLELLTQFTIIVDFTVEHNPPTPGRVTHGLVAGDKVNDT
jgi:hypothetical protein